MAISATIYKAELNIVDTNRHYYQQHDLTVAMHPSENEFRLMTRIIVFALNAADNLAFTKGLSTDDEPELWVKSLSDEIELWIDFGQVDEKRIRKACGKATAVKIYTYNRRKSEIWWQQHRNKLERHQNLNVYQLHAEGLEQLVDRKMQLQCHIQDNDIFVDNGTSNLTVNLQQLR